jgi:hypothetical protein
VVKQLNLPPGLSRAQRLAVAAAMAGQAACSSSTVDSGLMPVYGAPLAGASGQSETGGSSGGSNATSGRDAGPNAGRGGQVAVAVYGAPIAGQPSQIKDAGLDSGDDEDAGPKDAGPQGLGGRMAVPLYGAPVPVYGAPPNPKR